MSSMSIDSMEYFLLSFVAFIALSRADLNITDTKNTNSVPLTVDYL